MSPSPQKKPRGNAVEEADTSQLRKVSRHTYLARRETQQLDKLRDEIVEKKALSVEEKLTEQKRRDLELKEQIYRLAVERTVAAHDPNDVYQVPDADGVHEKDAVDPALSRYIDAPSQHPTSDQAQWELEQIRKGRAGPIDAQASHTTQSTQYELVFDELDFEHSEALPGKSSKLLPAASSQLPEETPAIHHEHETRAERMQRIQKDRKLLPMFAHREELLEKLRKHQILIVQSETGSGKTTQLPQYVVEAGFGRVVCTQPRRVAAMSVATRVAHEMGVRLGGKVGYSIRFEDCSSEETEIKFVTDGMLLREFLSEPDLNSYKVIMIDEAHERSLSTDVVMGLVKDIARHRGDDVRVIISSATMDTLKFSKYFDDAPVYTIPGRRFEVDIFYALTPEADYLDACCTTVFQIHASQSRGDILVFLTGQDEIDQAEELLYERISGFGTKLGELIIAPIYANLPAEQQAKIFEPTPDRARKVVLATNVAETSVTIPGIVYVVDPGFCKQKQYNAKTGVESLLVVPVSRAGAKQRAGRAGRTQPGKCFRLYTKWSYEKEMDEDTPPELLRSNLSQVVLLLMSLGIDHLFQFDFIDPPPPHALIRSLEHLYALGALNEQGQLTKLGRRMAELPLDPMTAKALLASEAYACSQEVTIICGMLSVNNSIFYRPKGKKVTADAARAALSRGGGGDHLLLLRCYVQWRDSGYSKQWCAENFVQARSLKRARDIVEQLDALLDRVDIKRLSAGVGGKEMILKSFTAGFFYNAVRLQRNGHYRTLKNTHTVYIHPSSSLARSELRPRWLIYHELVFTSKEYMRQVFDIEGRWLFEVAPHFYKEDEVDDSASNNKMPRSMGKSGARIRKA